VVISEGREGGGGDQVERAFVEVGDPALGSQLDGAADVVGDGRVDVRIVSGDASAVGEVDDGGVVRVSPASDFTG
jgi:hypothetical protein